MKPDHIWKFYQSLRGRGMSLVKIAKELQTQHGHLSQVVNGTRGGHTRRKMTKFLTASETDLLGWEEKGEVPEPVFPTLEDVPHETLSHMEQQAEPAPNGGGDLPAKGAKEADQRDPWTHEDLMAEKDNQQTKES